MANDESKRLTISLSQQTKEDLDAIKHQGQSYNGLIQELVNFWEKEHAEKVET